MSERTNPLRGGSWQSEHTGKLFTARTGREVGSGLTNEGAGLASTGIGAATEIAVGVIGASQSRKARSAEYQRGLDDIFEARKRADEQHKMRRQQEDHRYYMDNSAFELDLWQRKVKDQEEKLIRGYESMQRLRKSAESDENMRDMLLQFRNMGGV